MSEPKSIAQLTADNERLRTACAALLPLVQDLEDKGPWGEGWQSEELIAAIAEARAAIALEAAE